MPPEVDEPENLFDRSGPVFAAGAAAVILVGLLIFAVMRTADDSPDPSDIPAPASSTLSGTWTPSTSTTTSYAPPSAQTSEQYQPPPAPPSPPGEQAPTEDETGAETDTPTTPTTIFNPYVTTTPPVAGHV